MIDLNSIIKMLEVRTGLNHKQSPGLFDAAIAGAIEEIGLNSSIVQAQKTDSKAIAASANAIRLPEDYIGRMVVVEYQFDSGGETFTKNLDPCSPKDLSVMNEGQQGYTHDGMKVYSVSGGYLRVGPHLTLTGGYINMTWQRPLETADIDMLTDHMAIVYGAHANMINIKEDPQTHDLLRRTFVAKMLGADEAYQPSFEKVAERQAPDIVLFDQAGIAELG